ncbi:hypothetical protein PybrP1_001692 [[Pythium] brassicae (nom. inval.)]|nr:hypothetical protein PybrP1_001692 [[Pythium] brassicae (nom. inval.)]
MNDPFASLDPIQKPKTAAERVLTGSTTYNHPPAAPIPVAQFGGGAPGLQHMNMMPAPGGVMAPGGMGTMNMNGMGPSSGMNPSMGLGMGMGMGPGGVNPVMSMGMNPGMPMGMGMGMGQPPHNPFQQPHQHSPHQEPVMYDNIKSLLQQKPKAPAVFEDSASMDFLANLGGGASAKTSSGSGASFPGGTNAQVRAAEPTSTTVAADPFGGGFSTSSTSPSTGSGDIGLSIFETGGNGTAGGNTSTSVSPASGAGDTKSSALAARLANGRRKTQEMQRSQLQLNATSFAHSGGAAGAKISLKEVVGQAPSKASKSELSLDAFSPGGGSAASNDFGSTGDDPFGMAFGSSSSAAPTRTGSRSAVRQGSFEASSRGAEEAGSRPVDDHDSTLW